ncbi:hypothetical protein Chor_000205 [Crotalus horridus]
MLGFFLEQKLKELMCKIQDNVKGLGLLKPYNWKNGDACVVRAADTMWYRGEVKDVGAGIVKVLYMDYGYTEKIPPCHLYPTILYAEIPPFSIPCQLYKTVPVGNIWQQDAVELLKELLTKRSVKVHIMEQSDLPWGKVSVKLWFSGMSLSYFMAFHKHCITKDDDDSIPTWDMLESSNETLEENCEISYEVYISIVHSNSTSQQREMDSDTLEKALAQCNQNIETLPHPTDFQKEIPLTEWHAFLVDMPCLAEYSDGLWYRAKLISILEFNPVSVLVEFVDYGSTKTLPTNRLRQIPHKLMQYPVQAFRVLLAGFKPALNDSATERIPYCSEWSLDALWAAMNCFEGKNLSASSVVSFFFYPSQFISLSSGNCIFLLYLNLSIEAAWKK